MATIKSKIIVNIIILLIAIIGIVGMEYYNIHELGIIQDEGAKRSSDVLDAVHTSMAGMALYQVIADAEINHDLDKAAKEWAREKVTVQKNIELITKAADTEGEKKLADEAKLAVQEIVSIFEGKILPLLSTTDGITPEIRELDNNVDLQVKKVESAVDKLVESMHGEMKDSTGKFDSRQKAALIEALIIGIIAVLLQAGLGVWLMRTIMYSIDALRAIILSVCEGDLTQKLKITTKDELSDICDRFNGFIDKLHGMISQISTTSNQVAVASGQLTSSAELISTGAEEVAGQSATVATAAEEMSATAADIAQNSQMAAEGAMRASSSATNGATVVDRTVLVMEQISLKVDESAKIVERLGGRSDQIGVIVATIEDIADQTNLLALNAAIEAARAGEQGRGFAVVADEVRALAVRTTRATKEIAEMIKAIQNETRMAVSVMELGVAQVETGTVEAANSGDALRDILVQVRDVAMQVNQIATAAEEQTSTTREISSNMQQITQVVEGSASGAHQTATAASQLHANAEELQRLVQQFKL